MPGQKEEGWHFAGPLVARWEERLFGDRGADRKREEGGANGANVTVRFIKVLSD